MYISYFNLYCIQSTLKLKEETVNCLQSFLYTIKCLTSVLFRTNFRVAQICRFARQSVSRFGFYLLISTILDGRGSTKLFLYDYSVAHFRSGILKQTLPNER